MLSGKQAFLFDLDGTLVDSMWMWKEIDIQYLGRFGLSCPADLQKSIEGMSFTETAVYFKERFQIDESIDRIKRTWEEMSVELYRSKVPLKPGAGEFLEWAKRRRIPMGIATSNGREMVNAVLDSLKIRDYFASITTACEVKAGKPAPDIYLKVAADLETEPARCLVFEDVPAGILAGKRAGMEVCAVDDLFSKNMRTEKESLADYFIEDYHQLMRTYTE